MHCSDVVVMDASHELHNQLVLYKSKSARQTDYYSKHESGGKMVELLRPKAAE